MAAGCSFVGYSGLPYLYHRRRRATARSPACAVTAPIRAHDSLQGRHPPVIGRPQAVRPPSRPHGPLRALQTCGGNPGVPLNHPSTPLPGTAGSRIDRGGARPRPSLVGSQATTRTTIDGRQDHDRRQTSSAVKLLLRLDLSHSQPHSRRFASRPSGQQRQP